MKFSESWLREWVNPSISTDELVSQITMAGLEVDAVEAVAGEFSGVIVGEITKVVPHPDAEKLRICTVVGHAEGDKQVVCGAPNARAGIKVPFATIGARLPGDFKIKKAKLRGVESFGMLCAQTELQAGDDDDGLWELPAAAPVGEDLRAYLNLNDSIIEVDLTPNRGDCLSIRGLAREVGVLNQAPVQAPTINPIEAVNDQVKDVQVEWPEACPQYAGRVIANVDVSRPSPLWLLEKLRRSGVRSIDALVDITNYVLLELGQPMHAFDLDALSGSVRVRKATEGESLTLLDEQVVKLKGGSLVIADDNGPLALAGIMGGHASAVSPKTKNVFLESAFFSPVALAGQARSYGLHTDSSHRFERGVDFALQAVAIERATGLILEILGGEPGPVTLVSHKTDENRDKTIRLRKERLDTGLGAELDQALVVDMLGRLGLKTLSESEGALELEVPSWRFDLAIEEDLFEEVARIYGYDNLPRQPLTFDVELPALSETKPAADAIKHHLVSRGFQEVITYSFIDPALQVHFKAGVQPVALQNPISSEMSEMRTSLVPGLVSVLKTNLNRQKTRIRCFETGLKFTSEDGTTETLTQTPMVAGLLYGTQTPQGWDGKAAEADFYTLKGELEGLLQTIGNLNDYRFEAAENIAYMHPGQTAALYHNDVVVGYVGALHPAVLKALELNKPVYVFECESSVILHKALPAFKPLSRYPEVSRDMAVLVAHDLPLAKLEAAVKEAAGECLINLKLFDVYRGEGIDPERKSLAFSLTFQHPSRTLKDEEVNASMAAVIEHLGHEFDATLR